MNKNQNPVYSTKIAATIGQMTCNSEMLNQLSLAGVNLFRYNLAAQLGFAERRCLT